MTFSIVAQDGEAFGVAVASRFLAVGSIVPEVREGIGAVATQALCRVAYRRECLDAVAGGADVVEALGAATAGDPGREDRQVGLVGRGGEATWTGSGCLPWAGGRSGRTTTGGYAIQGNILTGPEVVQDMERAWLDSAGLAFPDRLIAALVAGDAAGGDSRGRQGAALYAVAPGAGYDGCGVLADLRVDDHRDATAQLARLLTEHDLVFGSPSEVEPLVGSLDEEVRRLLAATGHQAPDTAAALAAWASAVNYENRLSPDGIDSLVLAALRDTA